MKTKQLIEGRKYHKFFIMSTGDRIRNDFYTVIFLLVALTGCQANDECDKGGFQSSKELGLITSDYVNSYIKLYGLPPNDKAELLEYVTTYDGVQKKYSSNFIEILQRPRAEFSYNDSSFTLQYDDSCSWKWSFHPRSAAFSDGSPSRSIYVSAKMLDETLKEEWIQYFGTHDNADSLYWLAKKPYLIVSLSRVNNKIQVYPDSDWYPLEPFQNLGMYFFEKDKAHDIDSILVVYPKSDFYDASSYSILRDSTF